jgi:hypothetical protein
MYLEQAQSGTLIPEDVNVFIEIPAIAGLHTLSEDDEPPAGSLIATRASG